MKWRQHRSLNAHCIFLVSSMSWKITQPEDGFLVKRVEFGWTCNTYNGSSRDSQGNLKGALTVLPRIDLYVPSAIHRAPFCLYPLTRHWRRRLASPWQLSIWTLKRCIYFFNWERIETARDSALKDSACDLHHDDDFPWLTKALYAMRNVSACRPLNGRNHHLIKWDDPTKSYKYSLEIGCQNLPLLRLWTFYVRVQQRHLQRLRE